MELLNGGTLSIESPPALQRRGRQTDQGPGHRRGGAQPQDEHLKFYDGLGLKRGVFFDRETFGTDRLVAGFSQKHLAKFLADGPLSEQARRDVARIEAAAGDFLPGMNSAEKKLHLSKISYQDFLRNVVHADEAHRVLSGENAWLVGRRDRRGLGAGLLGDRDARLQGHETRAGSIAAHGLHARGLRRYRRLGDAAFPGRQRHDGAAAGARSHSEGRAGQHCRGRRHRAGRLRPLEPRTIQCACVSTAR